MSPGAVPGDGRLSRRGWLATLAATLAGCAGGGPRGGFEGPTFPVVDMHSHAGGVHFRREPGMDLAAQMQRGGLTAICLGHTGDGPVLHRDAAGRVATAREARDGELWRHTLARLDVIDGLLRRQGLPRILARGDLERAHRERAPGIVQMVEGCQFLDGRIERIAELHRRGVRQLQLLHFLRSDLGDHQTELPVHGGLTALGRRVIAECNRLGLVVDTAHGTLAFVDQAAEASRSPLLLSHTFVARQPAELTRPVTPEHARIVARTGGVVGVWGIAATGAPLAVMADRIARAAEAIGTSHVGIGSDIGGAPYNVMPGYESFPELLSLLRRRGFHESELAQMAGGNYLRVFNASVNA